MLPTCIWTRLGAVCSNSARRLRVCHGPLGELGRFCDCFTGEPWSKWKFITVWPENLFFSTSTILTQFCSALISIVSTSALGQIPSRSWGHGWWFMGILAVLTFGLISMERFGLAALVLMMACIISTNVRLLMASHLVVLRLFRLRGFLWSRYLSWILESVSRYRLCFSSFGAKFALFVYLTLILECLSCFSVEYSVRRVPPSLYKFLYYTIL